MAAIYRDLVARTGQVVDDVTDQLRQRGLDPVVSLGFPDPRSAESGDLMCRWSIEAYRRSDELCEWVVDLDADRASLERTLAIELPTPDAYGLTLKQARLAMQFACDQAGEDVYLDDSKFELFLSASAKSDD